MARLLSWPIGLGRVAYQRLTGPRTVGGASTESVAGYVQTVASAFGLWRFQISLQTMNKAKYRRYRGMVEALHGGANAVRVPFDDPDVMSFAEAGVAGIAENETHPAVDWSNDLPWSNGQSWGLSRPLVRVQAAAKGDTVVSLFQQHWATQLDVGDWLGFVPFHFGLYVVTQVVAEREFRIWPPLRAAIPALTGYATLNPVMAMRLESEAGGTVQRGLVASESNTLTLIEVEDADVRDYFAD